MANGGFSSYSGMFLEDWFCIFPVLTTVPYGLISSYTHTCFLGTCSYQSIQRAGTSGAWARDIRRETNILLQALNKIFKALESRKLIKQVKSVNNKSKKMYM